MKIATLSTVVFLSTLPHTRAYAQDLAVGLGTGSRDISALEGSVEEYLEKRAYSQQIPGLNDAINFEGMRIPYVLLTAVYRLRKPLLPIGTTEHLVELDWTSSLFGVKTDHSKLEINYAGVDLGNVDTYWSYKIDTYLSLGLGTHYTPLTLHYEGIKLRGGFILQGGFSYVNGSASLELSLTNNEVYRKLDPDMVADSFGIAENSIIDARFYGLGYFFQPTVTISLDIEERVTLETNWGYRAESIPVDVTETQTSIDTTIRKAKGVLDLSGETVSFRIEYHF